MLHIPVAAAPSSSDPSQPLPHEASIDIAFRPPLLSIRRRRASYASFFRCPRYNDAPHPPIWAPQKNLIPFQLPRHHETTARRPIHPWARHSERSEESLFDLRTHQPPIHSRIPSSYLPLLSTHCSLPLFPLIHIRPQICTDLLREFH